MTVLDPSPRAGVPTGASVRDPVMDERTRSRIGYGLIACGLALVPWLIVLATGVPALVDSARESLTWVGLDGLEAVGLVTTGLLVLWRDPRRTLAASATAALLLADAWFDTTTASSGADLISALAMAAVAELPLAVLCVTLTIRGLPRAGTASPRGGPLGSR
ncbi:MULTISPECIES: hypothetical protein [Streptomyces]|uniref:LPXTG cell wall anchor domain-containing protein n=1 Tax=Streptomyces gilvifuscus TaxID=1550617 RepID=A0ABT5FXK4_9ACTN|nr:MULTISPECIES: hypothetical protein [Streptomyces]MDC2957244.1 hypothetical protein [Streptomyces gilvifuscus]